MCAQSVSLTSLQMIPHLYILTLHRLIDAFRGLLMRHSGFRGSPVVAPYIKDFRVQSPLQEVCAEGKFTGLKASPSAQPQAAERMTLYCASSTVAPAGMSWPLLSLTSRVVTRRNGCAATGCSRIASCGATPIMDKSYDHLLSDLLPSKTLVMTECFSGLRRRGSHPESENHARQCVWLSRVLVVLARGLSAVHIG